MKSLQTENNNKRFFFKISIQIVCPMLEILLKTFSETDTIHLIQKKQKLML